MNLSFIPLIFIYFLLDRNCHVVIVLLDYYSSSDKEYPLFLIGLSSTSLTLEVISDDNTVEEGITKVRVGHLSPVAPAVDVEHLVLNVTLYPSPLRWWSVALNFS